MEMQPTPFPELNTVLQDLVESIQTILGDNFVGACLQGSFAVGDFDRNSDVDFIVALEDELSDTQVAELQVMHGRIFNLACPWAQHLEGSYFPKAILKDHTQRAKQLWYLDHGSRSLIQSDHCNTVLVRWVVRAYGVPLAGQNLAKLVDPIPVAALRQEIRHAIDSWGEEILTHPEHFNNWWHQGYIVLNFCRMVHDLRNGYPGSKRAGAEWAIVTLDPVWAGLIDRAWAGRPDPAFTVRQPPNAADFKSTLEFVKVMLNESKQYATA